MRIFKTSRAIEKSRVKLANGTKPVFNWRELAMLELRREAKKLGYTSEKTIIRKNRSLEGESPCTAIYFSDTLGGHHKVIFRDYTLPLVKITEDRVLQRPEMRQEIKGPIAHIEFGKYGPLASQFILDKNNIFKFNPIRGINTSYVWTDAQIEDAHPRKDLVSLTQKVLQKYAPKSKK